MTRDIFCINSVKIFASGCVTHLFFTGFNTLFLPPPLTDVFSTYYSPFCHSIPIPDQHHVTLVTVAQIKGQRLKKTQPNNKC